MLRHLILLLLTLSLFSCAQLTFKSHIDYNDNHQLELISQSQLKLPIRRVKQSAVHVLAYHEIGKIGRNSTPEKRLRSQLDYLRRTNFSFMSPEEVFKSFDLKEKLDRKIVLTVESEHESVLIAHRIFQARGLPYVLMINPQKIGLPNNLKWADIQRIIPYKKMTLGIRAPKQWAKSKKRITKDDIEALKFSLLRNVGFNPSFFSYPQGEYKPEYIASLKSIGFKGAFSNSSGVLTESTNKFLIPRFPMTRSLGELEGIHKTGFEQMVSTLPFQLRIKNHSSLVVSGLPKTLEVRVSPRSNSQELSCVLNGKAIELKKVKRGYSFKLSPQPSIRRYWLTCTRPAAANESNQPLRFRWQTLLLVSK